LPGETDEAYNAFCLYLNMGSKRSLYKLIPEIDSVPLSMKELASRMKRLVHWFTTFAWIKRVELCEQFIQDELLSSSTYVSYSDIYKHTSEPISTTQAEKKVLASNFPAKRKAKYSAP
jgi:hypothetical protein